MFIIPHRGRAVLLTLLLAALAVALTACATPRPGAPPALRSACPAGTIAVCRAAGTQRDDEACRCHGQAQVEARFEWLQR
jgi:hypothetical protein